jgi:ubiquinol-cytochrome c reductase iron-sulfur subunit
VCCSKGWTSPDLARRPLIRNTLIGAVALLGLPVIVSLRDLAKNPRRQPAAQDRLEKGMRVVQDVDGRPIRAR